MKTTKTVHRIALAFILATSFGLYAADNDKVDVHQLTEWIHNRNMHATGLNKKKITAGILATPIPTKFPTGSTTESYTIDGILFRTISDEAVEKVLDDKKVKETTNDDKVSQLAAPAVGAMAFGYTASSVSSSNLVVLAAATVGGTIAYFSDQEQSINRDDSIGVLVRLINIKGVSFNPSAQALARQTTYQQTYGFENLASKAFNEIAAHCAKKLVKERPDQAVQGMHELPLVWFEKIQNSEGYNLTMRYPVRTEPASLTSDNKIFEGSGAYNSEYLFPQTNVTSNAEWTDIQHQEYARNKEDYNYLRIGYGGRLGEDMAGGTNHHYYQQEKKPLSTVKGAKR